MEPWRGPRLEPTHPAEGTPAYLFAVLVTRSELPDSIQLPVTDHFSCRFMMVVCTFALALGGGELGPAPRHA